MPTIHLKPKHVQPVWAGHPWIFAQAVGRVAGAPAAGDVVDVRDPEGNFLGRGFYSPKSAIPVRLITREDEPVDRALLQRRFDDAAKWRRDILDLPNAKTNGYRLVNADGDQLPGVLVDVFDRIAVVQLLTIGVKRREEAIFAAVEQTTGATTIIEASSGAHKREGLTVETRVVRGEDNDALRFLERGFAYEIPGAVKQKTGFYFDQRDNRARVEAIAKGRRTLDAFCFTGAFSLAAARGGATEVVGIDRSAPALAAAAHNAQRNELAAQCSFRREDIKRALPELAKRGERFGLVICDPPKLAPTTRHVKNALKAYRRLNANAMRVTEKGGVLVTCSCSSGVKPAMFMRALALAAKDAKRRLTLLSMGEQGADHAVPSAFPEGRYLKCVFVKVS